MAELTFDTRPFMSQDSNMAVRLVKHPLPINPHVLSWARKWAGLTEEEAAKKAGTNSVDKVKNWESPESDVSPTVRQARNLAKAYGRPFLEFFLPDLPRVEDVSLVPDFRLYQTATDPTMLRLMKEIQRWAETQRDNAINLHQEIGEAPIPFPKVLSAVTEDNPENISAIARKIVGFTREDIEGLTGNDRNNIVNILRNKLEACGVLVLKNSNLKKIGVRGFSLTDYPLPTVVFGQESPRAQAFTIIHELGHLVLNIPSLCGYIPRAGGDKNTRKIEEWCDNFSASFLMPREEIFGIVKPLENPLPEISDDRLRAIANRFCVSDHAALVRLVNLNIVSADYYWNVKKPQFDAQEYRGGGRARFYGTRFVGRQGQMYTKLVLQAWGNGAITNHKAAEYMGIKRLSHLNDIRRDFSK